MRRNGKRRKMPTTKPRLRAERKRHAAGACKIYRGERSALRPLVQSGRIAKFPPCTNVIIPQDNVQLCAMLYNPVRRGYMLPYLSRRDPCVKPSAGRRRHVYPDFVVVDGYNRANPPTVKHIDVYHVPGLYVKCFHVRYSHFPTLSRKRAPHPWQNLSSFVTNAPQAEQCRSRTAISIFPCVIGHFAASCGELPQSVPVSCFLSIFTTFPASAHIRAALSMRPTG